MLNRIIEKRFTLYFIGPLDILLTINNFATTCQLTLIRVQVDCSGKLTYAK